VERFKRHKGRLEKHFVVKKTRYFLFYTGFEAQVASLNGSRVGRANGGAMRVPLPNEKALLTALVGRLAALDADVLVGHNISAFDLDVLLHRLAHYKVRAQAPELPLTIVHAIMSAESEQSRTFKGQTYCTSTAIGLDWVAEIVQLRYRPF
jgi:hypothetical protein